ncbi:MAG: hypothetical protein Q9218_003653 [Villophora microphyllina]
MRFNVRRLPNGRLVQERPRTARAKPPPTPAAPRPVATEEVSRPAVPIPAKKEKSRQSYVDPFAGRPVSPSSSSSDSSSDGGTHESKWRGKPKPNAPVKQRDKAQKKVKPAPLQIQSTPSSSTTSIDADLRAKPLRQDELPRLKKKVSFPPRLTRGKDRSYTPPPSEEKEVRFSEDTNSSSEEKSVRFSDELIRGKGPEYSDLTPRKSEKYPFITAAFDSRKGHRQVSPPAPLKPSIAKPEASKSVKKANEPAKKASEATKKSTEPTKKATMGIKKHGKVRKEPQEFDILSDSDDSFTDATTLAAPTIENEHPRRASATVPRRRPVAMPTSSSVPLKYIPGRGWVQWTETQSEIGTIDSYVDYVTTQNTKRNEVSERNPGLERIELERRNGAAPIPEYNRYGHRIRSNTVNTNMYDPSMNSRWPPPVFVMRGRNNATVPGHPPPVFVLGERSNSRRNSAATNQPTTTGPTTRQPASTKWMRQQSRRTHQPPSVIDADVDTNIYYDPHRNMTYRDV